MATQTLDMATLVNRALVLNGDPPSFAPGGDGGLNATVDVIWSMTVDRCLGLHDWPFLRTTRKLERQAETPQNGYTYGYNLPGAEMLSILRVLCDPTPPGRVLRDYTIEAGGLYCHADAVWLRYKLLREPETWPADFASAFVVALAAYLAVPVRQDEALRDRYLREAFGDLREGGTGGLFGRLIAQMRANEPVGSVQRDSISFLLEE